ncbi:hypothetical protein POMI540_2375 [Schizosaccharomyces pombe]|uniref:Uncharacterized protein C7D4.14c n=1 Tax=Schizosaccharomyces pombe (strain 972 / ATCC 24843) TaxID=284812 RepID=YFPE_SCHPO|nr:uncharacterized protein SPAC7D4.14c [Schizosaccharomyces pombe]O14269.1 RecName: Full=Uncharacterized protein C7D4.14c [Schizosaccharomyces pombe 972h-]CAB16731.1 sequence orphan [Schizosaccharomyces pombe]|eukprot:NP_593844.1 uncharacterized protein SPAC7D4.14c [Schizosaccharomyces pombe]
MDAVEPSVEKEYKKIISFRDTVFEGKHQQFLVPNNVRLKFLRDRLHKSLKNFDSVKRKVEIANDEGNNKLLKSSPKAQTRDENTPSEFKNGGFSNRESMSENCFSKSSTNLPRLDINRDFNSLLNSQTKPEATGLMKEDITPVVNTSKQSSTGTQEESSKPEKSNKLLAKSTLSLYGNQAFNPSSVLPSNSSSTPKENKKNVNKETYQPNTFRRSPLKNDTGSVELSNLYMPSPPSSALPVSLVSAPSPPRATNVAVPCLKHLESSEQGNNLLINKAFTSPRLPSPPQSTRPSSTRFPSVPLSDEKNSIVSVKNEEPSVILGNQSPISDLHPYSPSWIPYPKELQSLQVNRIPELSLENNVMSTRDYKDIMPHPRPSAVLLDKPVSLDQTSHPFPHQNTYILPPGIRNSVDYDGTFLSRKSLPPYNGIHRLHESPSQFSNQSRYNWEPILENRSLLHLNRPPPIETHYSYESNNSSFSPYYHKRHRQISPYYPTSSVYGVYESPPHMSDSRISRQHMPLTHTTYEPSAPYYNDYELAEEIERRRHHSFYDY